MRQIKTNPFVAISGEWFSAHGIGENLGYICKKENSAIAAKLRSAFAQWYDNDHTDENDINTCILKIKLTDGVLFYHGTKYEVDFKI